MDDAFGRHGHDLPSDKLQPLVFWKNARFSHALQFGHGETAPGEPFGGLSDPV
jgi:hypothetical protein